MKKEKYRLWPQFGRYAFNQRWGNYRKKIKGYYCPDCHIVVEDEPEHAKRYFSRSWYSKGLSDCGPLYLCPECRRPMKVRTLNTMMKPDCVCGHPYLPAHDRYGRHDCRLCDCAAYDNGKNLVFKHIAHRYLDTINGDFRGMLSTGKWVLIVTEKGHAFFKEQSA